MGGLSEDEVGQLRERERVVRLLALGDLEVASDLIDERHIQVVVFGFAGCPRSHKSKSKCLSGDHISDDAGCLIDAVLNVLRGQLIEDGVESLLQCFC